MQFLEEVQKGEEESWDTPTESSPNRQVAATTSRPTKAFNYATFEESDMDHYPTAVLAIRGMLRCSVRRGLDVSNVQAATTSLATSVRVFHFGDLWELTEEKVRTPVPSEAAAVPTEETDTKEKKSKKNHKDTKKNDASAEGDEVL